LEESLKASLNGNPYTGRLRNRNYGLNQNKKPKSSINKRPKVLKPKVTRPNVDEWEKPGEDQWKCPK